MDEYRAAWHPKAFLFEGQKGGAYSPTSLREAFKKALKKAGVTKDVSLHDLRHSNSIHLHEAGMDILYIQHLPGHKSSKTTEIYTHISKQHLQNVKSPLDDL